MWQAVWWVWYKCSLVVQENTLTYLKEHLPPLGSSSNPYHWWWPLQRQVPKQKTETYSQSFFPSTTTLWNILPESIQQTRQISQVKHFLSRNDTNPLPFFYNSTDNTAQIIHCKVLSWHERLKLWPIKEALTNKWLLWLWRKKRNIWTQHSTLPTFCIHMWQHRSQTPCTFAQYVNATASRPKDIKQCELSNI